MTSYGAIALARAFSFNDAFFHLNTVYGFGYFIGHTALPLTMWALIDWIIRRRHNRGNAYGDKGDTDRAIADYTQAIKLDPKFVQAYNNCRNCAKGYRPV